MNLKMSLNAEGIFEISDGDAVIHFFSFTMPKSAEICA